MAPLAPKGVRAFGIIRRLARLETTLRVRKDNRIPVRRNKRTRNTQTGKKAVDRKVFFQIKRNDIDVWKMKGRRVGGTRKS